MVPVMEQSKDWSMDYTVFAVITGTIGVVVFSHADSFWMVPVMEQSKDWSMDHTVLSLLAPLV